MTPKLAILSGLRSGGASPTCMISPLRPCPSANRPCPHCGEISWDATGVASAPRRRGTGAREPSALQPLPAQRRGGGAGGGPAAPEAARGARGGSVCSRAQPRTARAAASASRSPGLGARKAEEGRRRRRTGRRAALGGPCRLRVFLADPGKCGRPNPDQPPGSGAAEVGVPGSGWRASGGRLTGGFAVDMGAPGPKRLANSLRSRVRLLSPSASPKPPCFGSG